MLVRTPLPELLHVHVALAEHDMVALALVGYIVLLAIAYGAPEDDPPLGVNVAPLDLPYRLDNEIAPEDTPAMVRTAVSPRDTEAVLDRPSSTFTFERDIGPEV